MTPELRAALDELASEFSKGTRRYPFDAEVAMEIAKTVAALWSTERPRRLEPCPDCGVVVLPHWSGCSQAENL